MPNLEKNMSDWLGLDAPPPKKGKGHPLNKSDIAQAVSFMENGTFSESQLALGLLGITYNAKQLLAGGLTHEALFILIQSRLPNMSNGKKPSLSLIENVLKAVAELDQYVDQEALAKVREARSKK